VLLRYGQSVVLTPATRQRLCFEFLPTVQDAFPSAAVYIVRHDVAKPLVVAPRGSVRCCTRRSRRATRAARPVCAPRPPEVLTRAPARKEIQARCRRSHYRATIGLRARTRQPDTGDHRRRRLSFALQTLDGVLGMHKGTNPTPGRVITGGRRRDRHERAKWLALGRVAAYRGKSFRPAIIEGVHKPPGRHPTRR
jgi:hypothetical protein